MKFKNHITDVNVSYQKKTVSIYQNRMEDITDKEFQFLINYSKMTKDTILENYIRTLYKKIPVKENDTICLVFMQESLILYIKENQVMIIN